MGYYDIQARPPGLVEIPYRPRNWANVLHNSDKRWLTLVLHRRAGKTTAVLNHLQRDALLIKDSRFAYIAPTYKQAKMIAWDILKTISRPIPGTLYSEQDLTVKYPNGSKIFLVGSENPDSLRGIALWGAAFDEYSQQSPTVFSEIISKCLADHLGYGIFLGTPKGKNQFWKVFMEAKQSQDWDYVFRTIEDSFRYEKGETIDNLKKALEDDRKLVTQGLMTQDEFLQEWYCSFEASVKGAFYAKEVDELRSSGRVKILPYDRALKVHTVTDLGIGPRMATGFYQKTNTEVRMIDYHEGDESEGLPQLIKALQMKPYIYGKHFAPHDIDSRDIGTGRTRWEIARDLGVKFERVPELTVDDGINAGRLFFSKLHIDKEKCATWLDAVSQYHQEWDDKKGMFKPRPYHDWTSHPADVHRYAALVEKMFTNEVGAKFKQAPYQPQFDYEG
jgi:hypothetical protein